MGESTKSVYKWLVTFSHHIFWPISRIFQTGLSPRRKHDHRVGRIRRPPGIPNSASWLDCSLGPSQHQLPWRFSAGISPGFSKGLPGDRENENEKTRVDITSCRDKKCEHIVLMVEDIDFLSRSGFEHPTFLDKPIHAMVKTWHMGPLGSSIPQDWMENIMSWWASFRKLGKFHASCW